jgi:two-component system, OmpR family, response regulator MprA
MRHLRVLVVDDDEIIRQAIRRTLAPDGHHLVTVPDSIGALALGERFDVGVLDINLVVENGLDVARRLLDAAIVTRVVFFTAEPDPDILVQAWDLGPVIDKDLLALRHFLSTFESGD